MNENGMVGIMVLWLLAGLSAIAMHALAIARWQLAHSVSGIEEERALYLAFAGAILAHGSGFSRDEAMFDFEGGRVRVNRQFAAENQKVRLRCVVETGKFRKELVVGWKKAGAGWRADFWREIQ